MTDIPVLDDVSKIPTEVPAGRIRSLARRQRDCGNCICEGACGRTFARATATRRRTA
jgi:hypothetical protein